MERCRPSALLRYPGACAARTGWDREASLLPGWASLSPIVMNEPEPPETAAWLAANKSRRLPTAPPSELPTDDEGLWFCLPLPDIGVLTGREGCLRLASLNLVLLVGLVICRFSQCTEGRVNSRRFHLCPASGEHIL